MPDIDLSDIDRTRQNIVKHAAVDISGMKQQIIEHNGDLLSLRLAHNDAVVQVVAMEVAAAFNVHYERAVVLTRDWVREQPESSRSSVPPLWEIALVLTGVFETLEASRPRLSRLARLTEVFAQAVMWLIWVFTFWTLVTAVASLPNRVALIGLSGLSWITWIWVKGRNIERTKVV